MLSDWKIFILGFILGIALDFLIKSFSDEAKIRHKRYHVHHSVWGIVFIVAGLFIYRDLLIGLGIGIILSHTLRLKKLVFVEKIHKAKGKGRKKKK